MPDDKDDKDKNKGFIRMPKDFDYDGYFLKRDPEELAKQFEEYYLQELNSPENRYFAELIREKQRSKRATYSQDHTSAAPEEDKMNNRENNEGCESFAERGQHMPVTQKDPGIEQAKQEALAEKDSLPVESVDKSALSAGKPLTAKEQADFAKHTDADLGSVRIHTDKAARDAAEHMNADAFTIGDDIAFAEGKYQPGTAPGKELMAHELTHVGQQRTSGQIQVQKKEKYDVSPYTVIKQMFKARDEIAKTIRNVESILIILMQKSITNNLRLATIDPREPLKAVERMKRDIENCLQEVYSVSGGALKEIDGVCTLFDVPLPDAYVISGSVSKAKGGGLGGGLEVLLIKNYGAVLYAQGGFGPGFGSGAFVSAGPVWGILGKPARYTGQFIDLQVGLADYGLSLFGNYDKAQGWVFGMKGGKTKGSTVSGTLFYEGYTRIHDPKDSWFPDAKGQIGSFNSAIIEIYDQLRNLAGISKDNNEKKK